MFTLSPASCCVSAAHSGSQANTLSAAWTLLLSSNKKSRPNILCMIFPFELCGSILVRAMRAHAHDVLHEDLVVRHALPRVVVRQLQPYARELAGVVIRHPGEARRVEGVAGDDIAGVQRAYRCGARIEAVVTQTGAPGWHELIHALHIPAALHDGVAVGDWCAGSVVSQQAVFLAAEIFALHLQVALTEIAVGRVFPHQIQSGGVAGAAEAVAHAASCAGQIRHAGAERIRLPGMVQRHARAPALLDADIVADVREQGTSSAAVLRGIRAGKAATLADFSTHLDERIRRRQPFELHAVL